MTVSLFRNSIILLFILLFTGCGEDECIDIESSDYYTKHTKEWFVNDSINIQTIVDDNGFKQSLMIVSRDSFIVDDAFSDDCGNIYNSFMYSVQYNTSISPYNFMIDINGGCITNWNNSGQFTFNILITNYKTGNIQKAKYDFVTDKTFTDKAGVILVKDYVLGRIYDEILEITFNETVSPDEIKKVIFAKGFGIVMFIDGAGNRYTITE